MGWGFRVTCPDCRHEWEGIETSCRLGPWSRLEFPAIQDGFRSWFCPRCFFRLDIPRSIERNVWRKWYRACLAGWDAEPDAWSDFLPNLTARLDAVLSQGKFYVPLSVAIEPGDCPGCHRPFEESHPAVPDRLVCPNCKGRGTILAGYDSHCSMLRGGHGFH